MARKRTESETEIRNSKNLDLKKKIIFKKTDEILSQENSKIVLKAKQNICLFLIFFQKKSGFQEKIMAHFDDFFSRSNIKLIV